MKYDRNDAALNRHFVETDQVIDVQVNREDFEESQRFLASKRQVEFVRDQRLFPAVDIRPEPATAALIRSEHLDFVVIGVSPVRAEDSAAQRAASEQNSANLIPLATLDVFCQQPSPPPVLSPGKDDFDRFIRKTTDPLIKATDWQRNSLCRNHKKIAFIKIPSSQE